MPALNALHEKYRDRAAFYIVYITEAHPIDAWQVNDNLKDDVLVATTKSAEERYSVANICVRNLGINLPAVVDGPDNAVEEAYSGWPDRLYVIGTDGRIVQKSGPGPFGFKPAEVETALRRLLD